MLPVTRAQLRVYDVRDGRMLRTVAGHVGGITHLWMDSTRAVTAGLDRSNVMCPLIQSVHDTCTMQDSASVGLPKGRVRTQHGRPQ